MTKVDSVQICGLDPCILSSFKVENSLPDTLDLNSFDEAKCDIGNGSDKEMAKPFSSYDQII